MAKYTGADVGFFLIDGFELSGYTIDITHNVEAQTEESHTLGDSWAENTSVQLNRFQFDQSGFFDDAIGASNEALVGLAGAQRQIALSIEGNTLGKKYIAAIGAVQSKYSRTAARGALHKGNATHMGSGAVEEGLIHTPLGALAGSSGNGTAVDNAASTSNGGVAHVHVTQLTLGGYTNLALKVRHSADNSTYADLATFTVVTAAPAAERVVVAGTVNRYTRSNWAYNGAGSSQSATAFIGFKRNP